MVLMTDLKIINCLNHRSNTESDSPFVNIIHSALSTRRSGVRTCLS